jgi:hypothetical protein
MNTTTWKELQETCLRKMFSLDGVDLVRDNNTSSYLNSMPAAANEAMNILVTVGRYWRKYTTIRQEQNETAQGGELLGNFIAYDLGEMTGDFYCMDRIKLAAGNEYGDFHNYRMEGDNILLLPADVTGTFRIWYNAYPPKITKETADDFEIGLPPEVAGMIAMYMAGQLYKDDDAGIATGYINEFMVWLEELKASAARARSRNAAAGGGWTSVKGYY